MDTATLAADRPAGNAGELRRRRLRTLHLFQERVKELVAQMLQDDAKDVAVLMGEVVAILPSAWQYPGSACARIIFGEQEFGTPGFRSTAWRQAAPFVTDDGTQGLIEVDYLQEFPACDEGPFLSEERSLLDFLADMFHRSIGRKLARQALLDSRDQLELRVQERTSELEKLNAALRSQQEQLRSMAAQLSLAEERERRSIAANLHDHIGQTLAMAKIKLAGLARTATAEPSARGLSELKDLIDESIQYTRSLTFELSSPLLYELGLASAVEALAEQLQDKYGVAIAVESDCPNLPGEELKVVLFKAIRELLMNAIKHAHARRIRIILSRTGPALEARVEDDGRGFDAALAAVPGRSCGFGLFSIREGMRHCGGRIDIRSRPGQGTQAVLTAPLPDAPQEART
ncbi:MAG: sensor histidine kinase [Elusimicrobiota bacterium]|jgi:signal transduction histidine kinase